MKCYQNNLFVGVGLRDPVVDSGTAEWQRVGSSVCVGLDATEAPAGSGGAGAQGASTNELHSFPHFGIWWPIVLGHRGRSDAICWHVQSFHKLPIPLRPWPAEDKQGQLVVSPNPHHKMNW